MTPHPFALSADDAAFVLQMRERVGANSLAKPPESITLPAVEFVRLEEILSRWPTYRVVEIGGEYLYDYNQPITAPCVYVSAEHPNSLLFKGVIVHCEPSLVEHADH